MAPEIERALQIASRYGQIDGAHHKAWVIDQMVRALTDCPMVEKVAESAGGGRYFYEAQGESLAYQVFVTSHNDGEDGPETYGWDIGIAP